MTNPFESLDPETLETECMRQIDKLHLEELKKIKKFNSFAESHFAFSNLAAFFSAKATGMLATLAMLSKDQDEFVERMTEVFQKQLESRVAAMREEN